MSISIRHEPAMKLKKMEDPRSADSIAADAFSGDHLREMQAVTEIRNLAGPESRQLLNDLLINGVVKKLVDFLQSDWCVELAQEAAIALTNAAFFLDRDHLVQADVVPALLHLIQSTQPSIVAEEPSITLAGLYTIAQLAMGDANHVDYIITCGVCTVLNQLLNHSDATLVEAATFIVASIAREHQPAQIDAFFDADIPVTLIHVFSTSENVKRRSEAAAAIGDIAKYGSSQQIDRLCAMGLLYAMCQNLARNNRFINGVVLDVLSNILAKTSTLDLTSLYFQEYGGLNRIEALLGNSDESISSQARAIIDRYFVSSDDDYSDYDHDF